MDIQTSHVHFDSSDGARVPAYLAQPTGTGPFPGIVVIQEVFGVNAHIRDVTDRLAREGFVAVAPEIFHRTAPGFEVGYSEKEMALGRSHKDRTTASQLLADVRDSIAFLRTLGRCGKERFGAIGFCFGGHVAFLAATLPEVAATASFYGAGIPKMTPGGGPPSLTRAKEIHGKIFLFFGESDPLIPREHIDAIEAELGSHGIDHRVFRYPAGHGFFCDKRADYHEPSARDAWEHVRELFEGIR